MTDRTTMIETALRGLLRAWESLPVGNHSSKVIGEWLNTTMKEAFNSARTALAAPRTFTLADEARGWNAAIEAAIRVARGAGSSVLISLTYDEACRDIAAELETMKVKEASKQ